MWPKRPPASSQPSAWYGYTNIEGAVDIHPFAPADSRYSLNHWARFSLVVEGQGFRPGDDFINHPGRLSVRYFLRQGQAHPKHLLLSSAALVPRLTIIMAEITSRTKRAASGHHHHTLMIGAQMLGFSIRSICTVPSSFYTRVGQWHAGRPVEGQSGNLPVQVFIVLGADRWRRCRHNKFRGGIYS